MPTRASFCVNNCNLPNTRQDKKLKQDKNVSTRMDERKGFHPIEWMRSFSSIRVEIIFLSCDNFYPGACIVNCNC